MSRSHCVGRHQGHRGGTGEEDCRQSDLGQCLHSIEKDSEAWRGGVNFPITQLEVTGLEFSPRLSDSDCMRLHHDCSLQCCAT